MKFVLTIFLCLFLFTSCEKLLFEAALASTDPKENFEYLWQECKEKYAYFDLKNINWDSVRTVYDAKLYPDMSEDSLFQVLGGMLRELRDDHANLISDFNVSFYGLEYLAQDNFDWRILVDHYLPRDYYISGPFSHAFLAHQEIGYLRLSTFTGTIDESNLDYILDRYRDTKGLIIDIRENGGGAIADVYTLLSRFIAEETLVYYSRIKTGTGQNDFSPPQPVIVAPYSGIRYSKKVVMLTDRGTYSAGSLLALGAKALPNVILVGDTSGGGLGMPNGGQLPNGWIYRFSITQSLTLDQNPDFENGVPADIPVLLDWTDLSTDEILERAMAEIL